MKYRTRIYYTEEQKALRGENPETGQQVIRLVNGDSSPALYRCSAIEQVQ